MVDGGRKRVAIGAGIVAAILVVVVVAAALLVTRDGGTDDEPSADETAVAAALTRFGDALAAGTPGKGGTVQPAAEVDAEYVEAVKGLDGVVIELDPGAVTIDGDRARVPVTTDWDIGGARWQATGVLALERVAEDWKVRWALASLDRRLSPGAVMAATRTAPTRGSILGADGAVLAVGSPVVVVGIEPRRVADLGALVAELDALIEIDPADLTARVEAAAPGDFVEVASLPRADYDEIRDAVRPLPGTVFRELDPADETSTFARALLGTVAPATEEEVAASEGRLELGQPTGQSGLQLRYDAELAGQPGLDVVATATDGSTVEIATVAPKDGVGVQTSLDRRVQEAAEAALVNGEGLRALVALRVSTGEVLAVANGPAGVASNVALNAEVPPGSTFKVVSTLAYLRNGLDPDQIVPCPATTEVGGRSFKNAGGFALGDVPFRTDFARSCNTAFVELAETLPPEELTAAAAAFGIGGDWDIGASTFTGSVPEPESVVDTAASAIGQGRLQMSPLAMAGVAATVASGQWSAPRLVSSPAPASTPAPIPLGEGEADTLRTLMRGVVTGGSGSALAGIPGGDVFAKTGTAEFGNEDPPETHAWIIGFQGDVAFAVFVELGSSGGGVAGPIAADFLSRLAA